MPSKQKPTWRAGLHDVYIAQDKEKNWFKIGLTSKNLEYYCKQLCYRTYGRQSHGKIKIWCSWLFESFWAAWYIEQTTISIVERFGFEKMRDGDWFAIDEPTMSVVTDLIDELAVPIRQWEQSNFRANLDCLPSRHRGWGAILKRERLSTELKFARPIFPTCL